jgi:hypothetical protein
MSLNGESTFCRFASKCKLEIFKHFLKVSRDQFLQSESTRRGEVWLPRTSTPRGDEGKAFIRKVNKGFLYTYGWALCPLRAFGDSPQQDTTIGPTT